MRRSLFSRALVALFLLARCVPVFGQDTPPGTEVRHTGSSGESARFLLAPVGARNVGLGGAVAGARGDIEGVLWNPASLAALGTSAAYLHLSNDFGTTTQVLGAIGRWRGLRIGLAYYHFDLGSIAARDASNRDLGDLDLDNHAVIVSLAHALADWIEVGLNYKLVRLRSACSGPCEAFDLGTTGHAFDLGSILVLPAVTGLTVGFLVRNLGPAIRFAEGGPSDPLPTRLRVGAALDVLTLADPKAASEAGLALSVRGDLQQTLAEFDDLDGAAGVEMEYREILLLRGGYAWTSEGRSGPAIGVGLRYRGIGLDFGRSFDDFAGFDSDAPFQLSLGFRF